MKRKLTSILLMSALVLGGASTFVSCKDYDGDQVAENNAKLAGLMGDLNNLKTDLDGLKGQVNGNTDAINSINNAIGDINDIVNGHTEKLADLVNEIGTINEQIARIDGIDERLEAVEGQLGDFITRAYFAGDEFPGDVVNALDKILEQTGPEEFKSLQELFDYLTVYNIPEELKNLSDSCAMIAGRDSLLNDRLNSLVTSVNVDMVSNPIIGSVNTPIGIKTKVLAGFVGGQIDKAAVEEFGSKVETGLAASSNLGNIYLTVNPAEVDATGYNLGQLVSRSGELAPGFKSMVLAADNTPVKAHTKGVSNKQGGYVATIDMDAEAVKINVNKDELKAVAKNVLGKLKGEEALDVTNAVRSIYNAFADSYELYGIKYVGTYKDFKSGEKDENEGAEPKTITIMSDYDIAAVTIKPLSFDTNISGVTARRIPSLPSFDALKDKLGIEVPHLENLEISGVGDITTKVMEYTVVLSNANVDETKKVVTIKYGEDATLSLPFTFHEETEVAGVEKFIIEGTAEIDQVITKINDALANVGEINNALDKVEDAVNKAGEYYTKAQNVINKFIGKANYLLDNANQMLQPIMLAGGKDNAFRLSNVEAAPTVVEGNALVLIPTSYNLELLAPAYMKSVQVGTGAAQVIDGSAKTVSVNLEKGLNTITYKAMDFYGAVRTQKYFVFVKLFT